VAPGLRIACAILAAALLLAATDVVSVTAIFSLPYSGLGTRLGLYVFDVAETLGVGGLLALAVGGFVRVTKVPPKVFFALSVVAIAATVHFVIGENVERGVPFVIPARFARQAYWVCLIGVGVLIPVAYALAARCASHRLLSVVAVLVALVVMFGDQVRFFDDYQGVHGVVACGAAMTGAGALAPHLERLLLSLAGRPRGRVGLAAAGLFAAVGVLVAPPNAVRCELFRQPCAVAPWVLAPVWSPPSLHAPVTLPPSPWFHDRSSDPPVPAQPPRPELPANAVIVLMTIDAVRADDVFDPANAELFPTLTQMASRGVVFRHAMASGTQTPLSIAGLFTGRTFSEQLWTEHGEGRMRFVYPAEDTSPRFPELLGAHGVVTFTSVGLIFLQNDFGVVRGFSEEKIVVKDPRHAAAAELVGPLLDRLRAGGAEPMFLYTHLTEPHAPYDRGRRDGTPHERYLAEISVADKHVGRVLKMLQQRYGDRWALFVTSDHGEAFGEHRTLEHAKSLYEELLHVPLFAMSPAFPPQIVDERVSLVDLGPTILDLFGLETPASFLGQSLAPLLAGGSVEITRPLFAEGRLRRAMVFSDGLKVIEDLRRKTVEVYDLTTDPQELRNLFDKDPARSDFALATLRAFFAAHTRTEGGYVPPWKP
jgi:hypothetical protein